MVMRAGRGRLGRLRAVILLLAALALGAIGLGAGSVGLLRGDDGEDGLAAPAGVTAVDGEAAGAVIVGWEGVDGAAYYRIGWVALDDISARQAEGREWLDAFVFADVGSGGPTEYAVSGVTPGRRYAFIVASAGRRFGAGRWSEWAYLTPAVGSGVSCPADGGGGPMPPAVGGSGTVTPTPAVAPTPTLVPTPTPAPTLTPAEAAALERAALAALYHATDGDNWDVEDHNWLSDKPLGEWSGVTTDNNGSVISLATGGGPANPFGNGSSDSSDLNIVLTGNVPAELGSLDNLRRLDLSDNQLTGGIPTELGRLASLHSLDLSGNQLMCEIPAELSDIPNLHFLYLKGNQLTGCLPAGLRAVPHNDLIDLGLAYCGQ